MYDKGDSQICKKYFSKSNDNVLYLNFYILNGGNIIYV